MPFLTARRRRARAAGGLKAREEGGRRLTVLVRSADNVFRLGGDEFAIIQSYVTSERDAEALCERIIARRGGRGDDDATFCAGRR